MNRYSSIIVRHLMLRLIRRWELMPMRSNVGIKKCKKCGKRSMKITFKRRPDGSFVEIWKCFEPIQKVTIPITYPSICGFTMPLRAEIVEGQLIRR